jgi:dipeptidyl aminopeptidase/acylaminoacyl peptidase
MQLPKIPTLAALAVVGALITQGAVAQVAPVAASAAQPIAAEQYLRAARFGQLSVSPSGRHLAVVMDIEEGRLVAAVTTLDQPGEFKVVGSFSNADVTHLHWVNDRRLVYGGAQPGYIINEGGAGLFAVDLDGSNGRQLVSWVETTEQIGTRIQSRVLPFGWFLFSTLDDGSDDVMVYMPVSDSRGDPITSRLARLNTRTGALRHIGAGMPDFGVAWLLDPKGEPRVVRVLHNGRERLHWRAPGSEEWQLVDDRPANSEDSLVPLALEGAEQLLVETRNGRDTSAVYEYDLRRRRLGAEPVAALNGFDTHASLVRNVAKGTVLGLHTNAAQPTSVWFDEQLAKVQQRVDAALPKDRFNRLMCGRCEANQHVLVQSRSDRNQGELYVFEPAAGKLRLLGPVRPWLAESTQGRRTFHRVPARDGLSLPVVLTHPPGQDQASPLPAVVLVHGGPWVRGSDRLWSGEAQFLASRGWRVIEVEFRGSTGFGWRHFRAGWQQWGLAMQDDLADAVAWAAQAGWVDRSRVCIFGSSYGGYAALMGPIRHPGTYRCAASHVGVTDIELLFNATWGDLTEQFKRHGMPALVGDPKRDSDRLRATSPLQRVAEIKVPVLLAQGRHDRRVPPEHADRFMAAARKANVQVERVDYEEGHGWTLTRHHADFMRRLEAFIGRAVK